MDVFSVWDDFTRSEDVEDVTEGATCDNCHTEIDERPFYSIGNGVGLDICKKCWNTDDIMAKFFKVDLIDRRDKTEKTNPLIWPCAFCNAKLGGGHMWHTATHARSPDSYRDNAIFDICLSCYDFKGKDIERILKSLFTPVKENCQIIGTRSGSTNIIDFTDCRDQLSFDGLPQSIVEQITKDRIESWKEGLGLFAVTETLSGIPFGSVMQWAPFTDDHDIPFHPAKTALMVDCHEDTKGRIASVCIIADGETNADVIFNNIEEYEAALAIWNGSKLSPGSEEYKELYAKVEKDFHDSGSNDLEHARICDSFSSYIRIKKGLDLNRY